MHDLYNSATSLYKTPCNMSLTLILVHLATEFTYLAGEESDFDIAKWFISQGLPSPLCSKLILVEWYRE